MIFPQGQGAFFQTALRGCRMGLVAFTSPLGEVKMHVAFWVRAAEPAARQALTLLATLADLSQGRGLTIVHIAPTRNQILPFSRLVHIAPAGNQIRTGDAPA